MRRVFRAFGIGLVALAVFSLKGDHPRAQGLVPVLVKDINTTATTSTPSNLTAAGSLLFFTASDATNGNELWKSDGTASGTVLVKDINPGSSNSNPGQLTNLNGTLYFTASEITSGFELWKSDGTAAGTVLAKDLIPGTSSGNINNLTNVNGTLFFVFDDFGVTTGSELWKSDGTAAGTVLVKDIVLGNLGSSPINLTNVNGTLYLSAMTSATGYELWKSDGTAAGTVLVKDIVAGTGAGNPQLLTNVNGTLFFTAAQSGTGQELWKSDGTAAGTVLVKDIALGSTSSNISGFTAVNGTVFFSADDAVNGRELWKSDGSAVGTVLVRDINPGALASISGSLLTNINGILFFSANDGSTGQELWKSDGTLAGTLRVSDINAGSASSNPQLLTNVNGTLFFRATTSAAGTELWKSDGTAAGTLLVKDIVAGSGSSSTQSLTNMNGTLCFSATNGVNGQELWKSDGTTSGTVAIQQTSRATASSTPTGITNVGGTAFFAANDDVNGRELWRSDGTTSGTVLVKDISAGAGSSSPGNLTNVNDTLFFTASEAVTGSEIWKSDGTAAGTVILKDIASGTGTSSPGSLTNVNGTLFFAATDTANGSELWKSDGTTAGTVLVKNIASGAAGSNPSFLVNVNGTLFFIANDGVNGAELWKSDGTAAGTVLVKDVEPGSGSSSAQQLTNVNGTLYFRPTTTAAGQELWRSDGTATGTFMVKDINPGTGSSLLTFLNVNGTLFLSANDGVNGRELWKSDGTTAGTVLIKDIAPGASSSSPNLFASVGGALFFRASDGANDTELWKSDGTAAGTVMVKDIWAGSSSSNPSSLANINGTLYFSASDGINGVELWQSDGTAAGTTMVGDIYAGSGNSNPASLTAVGSAMFFVASEFAHGAELWTLGKSDQTIAVPTPAPASAAYNSDFTVMALASSGLGVTITAGPAGVCTITAGGTMTATVHVNSGSGTCVVHYNQPGDSVYNAAPEQTDTVTATGATQTITFGALPNKIYGSADFAVSATASSGLAVTFSTQTPSACSVAGSILHIVAAGSCTVTASQIGDSGYAPALDVDRSFTIQPANLTVKADDKTKSYDGAVYAPFTATLSGFVNGDTESGLRTTGALSGAPGFTGAATTAINAGTFTITPTVGTLAATNYTFTTFTDGTLTIGTVGQTISVTTAAPATAGFSTNFSVAATSTSGLNVIITATPPAVCTISSGGLGSATVQMASGTGTCVVHYNQAGDGNYGAADEVTSSTTAMKATQTIAFAALGSPTYGDADFALSATASSGLAVSFTSQTTAVCLVSGSTVHIVAAGVCSIRASQPGDNDYEPAADVDRSLTINGKPLTASIIGNPTKPYNGGDVATLSAANFSLAGLIGTESFTITKTAGVYNSPDVTSANTVSTSLATGDFVAGAGTSAANYALPTTASGPGQITKADSTTTITCPASVGYTGAARMPCTASVTGNGGLSLTPTPSYTNNIDAGTDTASASYTFTGDDNHDGSDDTKTFSIAPATSSVVVTGGTFPYDGSAHGATAAVSGIGSGVTQTVVWSYTGTCTTAPTTVLEGTSCTARADYGGDANHAASFGTAALMITKAPSTTAVSCPASVGYTGAAQMPCTASVTGDDTLSLTPAPNYANNVNAGIDTASASYAFAGDDNHTGSSDSKTFSIDKAAVTATAGSGSTGYDGATHAPAACAITGGYIGDLSCANNPFTVGPDAGTTTITPLVSGTGQTNFALTPVSGSYTIGLATQTALMLNVPASITFGSTGTASVTGGSGIGAVTFSAGASTGCTIDGISGVISVLNASGNCAVTSSKIGDSNHSGPISDGPKAVTLNKATTTATITSGSPDASNVGQAVTVNFTVTSSAGAPSGNVTVSDGVDSCTGTVAAGTCSITMTTSGARTLAAIYAGDTNFAASSDTEAHQVNAVASSYTVAGFFAPIDMSQPGVTVWNTTMSGQSVPVKWRLTQNGGPVSDPNSFLVIPGGLFSYQVSCSTGAGNVDDAIEEYAPGAASLGYKDDGNWQYNWQTLKSYKNTCRVMFVKFSDGTMGPAATFKFK